MRLGRYLWVLPASVIGLMLASLALPGGRIGVIDGVIEAHGPLLRWALTRLIPLPGGASAITLGHVVLARDAFAIRARVLCGKPRGHHLRPSLLH